MNGALNAGAIASRALGRKRTSLLFFKVQEVEQKPEILSGMKRFPGQEAAAVAGIWLLQLHKYILTDYLWVVYIISYSTPARMRM